MRVGWVWTDGIVPPAPFVPPDVNTAMESYLVLTVYPGGASTDLTKNTRRRVDELTGEVSARVKAIIKAAGSSN